MAQAPTAEGLACVWLPGKMMMTIPVQDHKWILQSLFHCGRLLPDLKLWYEPPAPSLIYQQLPTPDRFRLLFHSFFFAHRLMVWIPYHLWKVRISCPTCGKHLTGYGAHKRAPKVLDIDRYYLMVTETLRCTVCSLNYLSTSQTVLNQLDLAHRNMFRIILTRKWVESFQWSDNWKMWFHEMTPAFVLPVRYACDIHVIRMLRDRTEGNFPARLLRQLRENHSEEWMNRLNHYTTECLNFMDGVNLLPVVTNSRLSRLMSPPEAGCCLCMPGTSCLA